MLDMLPGLLLIILKLKQLNVELDPMLHGDDHIDQWCGTDIVIGRQKDRDELRRGRATSVHDHFGTYRADCFGTLVQNYFGTCKRPRRYIRVYDFGTLTGQNMYHFGTSTSVHWYICGHCV